MVKNIFGGSKSKSIARKHEDYSSSSLRLVQHPSEKFAFVHKIFGGSICHVFCDDLISRKAIIRGKFRGKGKRHNIISSGTLVLVGLRDFSSDNDICDIIEVYSSFEFNSIISKPSFPSHFIHSFQQTLSHTTTTTTQQLFFSHEEELLHDSHHNTNSSTTTIATTATSSTQPFDFHDI